MERSAVYRRALAPIMLWVGLLGLAAGVIGCWAEIPGDRSFGFYWLGVSVVGVSAAYFLVRRQALKASEPFWSPPTRRVTQALLPPLAAGFVASIFILTLAPAATRPVESQWLVPIWVVLDGCAVHAAGFFMPRGMKLFGWGFLVGGCLVAAVFVFNGSEPTVKWLHGVMGFFFGGLHLAYGIYLFFTEQTK
jgi:hypothetical protein